MVFTEVAEKRLILWTYPMRSAMMVFKFQFIRTSQINNVQGHMNHQPNNPLHGLTLEKILTRLVEHYDWSGLATKIPINCFSNDPSIKSSLKFLRKTPWARDKVEALYISTFAGSSPWLK